ncbi:MAG: hypothetical protein K2O63_05515 [Alistipes sp.]|nr:hypothetical protein [Alistipes sp.]
MTIYPVIPDLYRTAARLLLERIGSLNYFSGTVCFDYGSQACRLVASIVVYRSVERSPEGTEERIDDLVPVWWEFHTCDESGERCNDFSFGELKRYML